jgi:hypothetical protein
MKEHADKADCAAVKSRQPVLSPMPERRMNSYLYLTIQGHVWIDEMLSGWRNSRKRFFCFPWVRFNVKTLKPNEFWLYLYYSQRKTPLQVTSQ